eukprot:COSAG04_NODE_5714_length_1514_cov_1.462191_2_plen_82_part_01
MPQSGNGTACPSDAPACAPGDGGCRIASCDPGHQINDDDSACEECPAGKAGGGAQACAQCEVGSERPSDDKTACECDLGHDN